MGAGGADSDRRQDKKTKRSVAAAEVSRHSSSDDCWLVIDGQVWDLSEYAPRHPGGAAVILKNAGRDASTTYNEVHSASVIRDTLDPSKHIGELDATTVTDEWARPPPQATRELDAHEKPPLDSIINTYDFEEVARRTLSAKTWAFYSSAATDCITRDANKSMLDRIWFRPRLLRNVERARTATTMLGCRLSLPLFISPSAMAKMAHPEGEKALARGAHAAGIVQCISSNASFAVRDIVESCPASQPFFFQLYVNGERGKTEELLRQVLSLRPRIRAVIVTIDAPVPGKREADERLKADEVLMAPNSGAQGGNDRRGGGIGRLMGSYIDRRLSWEDLHWIRGVVGPEVPLVLKGVQHAADARLAVEFGMQGIIVSNHGGRSLDTSPPAILTLLEMHRCCPEVFDRLEVYVDSGIRRGIDVLKCLCLGARAVGMGRSFLYSLAYGQEGVEHLVELLRDELETSMRLIGVTDVAETSPDMVNTGDVDHLVPGSLRHPYAAKARL